MRDVLENVQYAPSRGRYKVYLIDEVHMLSAHSFNALLKTLEEPPPHVKFLLATTDPQKLPVTVLSRCLQFHLKRLTPLLIAERMRYILGEEGIAYEAPALPLLARAADGSLRDALSLLDQVLVFGAGRVGEADVRAMLGTLDRGHVLRLLERLAEHDGAGLVAAAREFAEQAPDYDQVLAEIASLLVKVALLQTVPDSMEEGMQEWEPSVVAPLAGRMSAEDVQLYYQTALVGRRDLAQAPDPQTGFEMTLLRMLAFRPADGPPEQAVAPARAAPAARARAEPARPAHSARSAPVASRADPVPSRPVAGDGDWQSLVASLGLTGAAQQLAANCAYAGRDGAVVRLTLDPKVASLRTPAAEERLAQALGRHFAAPTVLQINADGGVDVGDTPAKREAREHEQRVNEARANLEADPTVRALKEKFNATVQADSVKPAR